jgi:Na+/proline symporter
MGNTVNPLLLFLSVGIYFAVLIYIGHITGKNMTSKKFFLAGKNAPWPLIALGMVGSSISGVTFISIPGVVGIEGKNMAFSYMQLVLGYLAGYMAIIYILLPLYYKYNLTSIYGYLQQRFGREAQEAGSGFFILSRLIQSAYRLFLVAMVMDTFVTGPLGIPFWITVTATIVLIYVYTFKGGINTIIWTDPLQTILMIGTIIFAMFMLSGAMEISLPALIGDVFKSEYSRTFFFEGGWSDPNNFFKQFLAGALITIVMTGLDQDMMQKNLSCRSLPDAQKNMLLYSLVIVVVNLMFLVFGAILYLYIAEFGIEAPGKSDQLFPMLALNYLPAVVGIAFILGLTAAAYSSADSALTALTTSFYFDILKVNPAESDTAHHKKQRSMIHIGFAVLLGICILIFNSITSDAIISSLFEAAGYTYGPILGLFAFGIFTDRTIRHKAIWPVALAAPILSYLLNTYSATLFQGFQFGFTIIALNGFLTFAGLWAFSQKPDPTAALFR